MLPPLSHHPPPPDHELGAGSEGCGDERGQEAEAQEQAVKDNTADLYYASMDIVQLSRGIRNPLARKSKQDTRKAIKTTQSEKLQ